MRMRPVFTAIAATLALAAALPPATARAQLTLVLNPDTLSGTPGSTVTYTGTIRNDFGSTVFLTSLFSQTLAGVGQAAVDDTSFAFYAPESLAAGTSYTGNLFDVNISPSALVGETFSARASVRGGTTPGGEEVQTLFADFDLFIGSTAIPEPGSGVLLFAATGGSGAAWLARRRRRPAAAS